MPYVHTVLQIHAAAKRTISCPSSCTAAPEQAIFTGRGTSASQGGSCKYGKHLAEAYILSVQLKRLRNPGANRNRGGL